MGGGATLGAEHVEKQPKLGCIAAAR